MQSPAYPNNNNNNSADYRDARPYAASSSAAGETITSNKTRSHVEFDVDAYNNVANSFSSMDIDSACNNSAAADIKNDGGGSSSIIGGDNLSDASHQVESQTSDWYAAMQKRNSSNNVRQSDSGSSSTDDDAFMNNRDTYNNFRNTDLSVGASSYADNDSFVERSSRLSRESYEL